MAKLKIDPVNRMEGHLGLDLTLDGAESSGYRISDAKLQGQLFRGFEIIVKDRDPRDAMVLCQRI